MTDRRNTEVWDPGCVPDIFTDECVSIDTMGTNARLTFVVPMFGPDEDGNRVIKERRVIARLVIPVAELDRSARDRGAPNRFRDRATSTRSVPPVGELMPAARLARAALD
jgi:hypothetical protein